MGTDFKWLSVFPTSKLLLVLNSLSQWLHDTPSQQIRNLRAILEPLIFPTLYIYSLTPVYQFEFLEAIQLNNSMKTFKHWRDFQIQYSYLLSKLNESHIPNQKECKIMLFKMKLMRFFLNVEKRLNLQTQHSKFHPWYKKMSHNYQEADKTSFIVLAFPFLVYGSQQINFYAWCEVGVNEVSFPYTYVVPGLFLK